MILPTKRLTETRSLLAIGGEILHLLSEPKTVSWIWAEIKKNRDQNESYGILTFDWFVLALDFLYTIQAVQLEKGLIRKVTK